MSAGEPRGGGRRWAALAAGSYLALALVAVLPVLRHPTTQLAGRGTDMDFIGHIWHCWWFGHSAATLSSPYVCSMVLLPLGSPDLLIKSGPCFNAALTVPWQPFAGVLGSYNLVLVLLLGLNAWAGRRLVLRLTGAPVAAWLAGVLAMVNPYVLHHAVSGRMDQASMGWFLLAVVAGLDLLERPRPRAAILTGVLTAITTLSYMGYGQMLVILLAFLALARLAGQRRLPDRGTLLHVGLAMVTFVVLMAPFLVAFASQSAALPAESVQHVSFPLWLRGFDGLTLPEQVIVAGSAEPGHFLRAPWGSVSTELLLPVSVLALAVFAGIMEPRSRLWLAVAGGFALLSLGPFASSERITAVDGMPLPAWLLYNHVPTMARMRMPARMLMPVWGALVVVVGFALALMGQLMARRPRLAGVAAGAVLALVLAEQQLRGAVGLPFPAVSPPEPSSYHSRTPGEPSCGIIGVPIQVGKPSEADEARLPVPQWQNLEMYLQSVHRRPMLSGLQVSFVHPSEHLDFLASNGVLVDIQRIQGGRPVDPGGTGGLAELSQAGFCEIAVTAPWLVPAARAPMAAYLEALLGEPRHFADQGIDVYRLPEP